MHEIISFLLVVVHFLMYLGLEDVVVGVIKLVEQMTIPVLKVALAGLSMAFIITFTVGGKRCETHHQCTY